MLTARMYTLFHDVEPTRHHNLALCFFCYEDLACAACFLGGGGYMIMMQRLPALSFHCPGNENETARQFQSETKSMQF